MTRLSIPFKNRPTVNLGLHSGAASGNLGLVKFALDNGQLIDSVMNGLLPIHAACAGGHIQVVKYLIERGCDVNSRRRPRRLSGSLLTSRTNDEAGPTALHYAAANGNLDLVDLLIVNGANITAVDKYGSTALSIALAKQHYGVAMLLQQALSTNPSVYPSAPHSLKSSTSFFNFSNEIEIQSHIQIEAPEVNPPISRGRRRSLPELFFSTTSSNSKVKSFRNLFRTQPKSQAPNLSTCYSDTTSPTVPIVSPVSTAI